MEPYKLDVAFINREKEMADLKGYLEARPNSILFLYGPKSSGKTTLMYRLFDQIEKENNYNVNFLNLRKILLTSCNDFIDAFFKLDAFTEKMLEQRKEDPFLVMEEEFKRLNKKGIRPIIIIDEIHKLDGLYMPDKQKRLMLELMNFFVAMTKESHLCHVIIASSDAFFIEQLYVDSKLRKTSKFMELDYLRKKDVELWLGDVKKHNKVQEYTLVPEQIEIIWQTVGGSAWEIYFILEELFHNDLESICVKLKREKTAMLTDWVDTSNRKEREEALHYFVDSPSIPQRQLMGKKPILAQAVHDNILFYDPIEAVYGIQGKSLEWGIKGCFADNGMNVV